MKQIKFPYYSGDIRSPYVRGYISINEFIDKHKNPDKKTLKLIQRIDKARASGDLKLKDKLKQELPTYTPSVMIKKDYSRRYNNITSFTGLMQIDLDKIPTEDETLDLKEHIFHSHEEIICCYLSPSRRGIKAIMKIKKLSMVGGVYTREYAIKKYKAIHRSIEDEFKQYKYFDSATKNCILPLFLSIDNDFLSRNFEDARTWSREKHDDSNRQNLNNRETFKYDDSKNRSKAIDIVIDSVNSIVDNGHPQVRTASLILGSRVGAGYISRQDAYALMENLIKSNNYLQKNINGYIKTSVWGIDNGIINPKYY